MKARMIFIFVCISLFCGSCNAWMDPNDPGDKALADDDALNRDAAGESALELTAGRVLQDFFASLNQTKYNQAAGLYGGSYELLQGYNLSIDEEDKVGLLQAACELNGFICLEVLSFSLIEVREQNEFIYEVEFANQDGSQFTLGPCCDASEETMPPVSSFITHVLCDSDGSCTVMDLPPYVP
jgi:hypothetical protein